MIMEQTFRLGTDGIKYRLSLSLSLSGTYLVIHFTMSYDACKDCWTLDTSLL